MKIKGLVFALLLSATGSAAATPLSPSDQAALQGTMFQFIERQLVGDTFLNVDLKNGTVQTLYPAKTHPMILRFGSNFVLCTDFRDDAGKDVNVDFYIAPNGPGYTVFRTEVDNREPLKHLMSKGIVSSAD
jgi:hypothetical protein